MANILYRASTTATLPTIISAKGSALSNLELDGNFRSLNDGKPDNNGTGATGTWNIAISGNAANVTGTVAIANGGTGATTNSGARTNLGATTVGSNLFTLTNPSAVTFIRMNADNTVSALNATDFRTAIGAGTSSTVGTVTSVGGTGTVSGLTLSGTVTSSGNLTLGGTLSVAASNFTSQTANTVLIAPNGAAGIPTFRALLAADIPTLNQNTTGSAGSVANSVTFNNGGAGAASGGTFNGSAAVTISHNTIGAAQRSSIATNPESSVRSADIRTLTNPTTGLGYFGGVRFRFSSLNDDNNTPYADVVDLSTYTDNSGGGFNALYFGKNSQTIQHKYAAAGGTAWTAKTLAYTDTTIFIGTSSFALNRASASQTLNGVSIDGNAGTVTNGVYTNGSYADPAWITSLAKSKVGLANVENTALSTWAGSTNITTVGAITPSSVTSSGVIASSSAAHRVTISTDSGGSVSLGRVDNVASAPYIDFNSGATTVDFDVRLAATGGTGAAGNGLLTLSGNLSITGNLTINGTTTTVNSTTVTIDDPIFTLGGDTAPATDDNKDRGIEFRWHNGTAAKIGFFGFDDSTGYLTFIPDATNTSEVFSGTQGDIQATNFRGALVGNASTASAWQAARTLTIGSTGKSVDGSAAVSWSLAEIGAPALSGLSTFTGGGSFRAFSLRTSDASGNNWSWFAMGGTSDSAGNVWHVATNGTAQDIGNAGAFHIRGNNGVTSSVIINQDHSVRFRSANVFLGATTNTDGVQVVTNSGTWGISISGNAATVTNGVYTSGSYANPAWITSLNETKVLPSQATHSGKFLTTNGTSTSWSTVSGGINYTRVTSNTTLVDKQGVIADTSGGTFTVTLPATPTTGVQVSIVDGANWSTTNLTVARNGSTIESLAEDLVLDIGGAKVDMIYDGTTWEVYTQVGVGGSAVDLSSAQTLTNKTISFSNNTLTGVASTGKAIAMAIVFGG